MSLTKFITSRQKKDFIEFILNSARLSKPAAEYLCPMPSQSLSFPFSESASAGPLHAVTAWVWELVSADGTKRHNVSLCVTDTPYDEPEFFFICGDSYLEGQCYGDAKGAAQRRNQLLDKLCPSPAKRARIETEMDVSFGHFPVSAPCGFFRKIRSDPNHYGCRHVHFVCHELALIGRAEIENILTLLVKAHKACFYEGEPISTIPASVAGSLFHRITDLASSPNCVPIRIEGPKGGGKTWSVRQLAKGFDHYEELSAFSGMEGFDFLGANLPHGPKGSVWVDGPVASAFRAAATKRTLLFIDEFYQVPRRDRGIFLGALVPDNGKYRIRTGRPVLRGDGTAYVETLEAPVENLVVIAATNSGDDYDVELDTPALMERWHTIIHDLDAKSLADILTAEALKQGFKSADKVTARLLMFIDNCEKLAADHVLRFPPSCRLLVRALQQSPDEAKLRSALKELAPTVLGRTPEGKLVPEQVKLFNAAIEASLRH